KHKPGSGHHFGAGRTTADDARLSGPRRSGRSDVLRTKLPAPLSARGRLCRQDSARSKARRPSGRTADQVRAHRERDYGHGPRPGNSSKPARPRRRGDRMTAKMKRREFITVLGTAAAWPLAARPQQPVPGVAVLRSASLDNAAPLVSAFRQGLKEVGFVEGQNVAIELRSAEGHNDRLSKLVTELIRLPVAAIACNVSAASVAKEITSTLPIVFATGYDPIEEGLVTSLSRPGGNITGVS